jgi:hypothetical protein
LDPNGAADLIRFGPENGPKSALFKMEPGFAPPHCTIQDASSHNTCWPNSKKL